MTVNRRSLLGSLILLATAIIWGSSFFVVKNTVDDFAPNWLIAIRFSGAAAVLALIFQRQLRATPGRFWWGGVLIGLVLYAAYAAQTYGITDTTPGKNAFLTAVYCVLVPFVWWILTRKRPDGFSLAAAFICLTGIAFISLDSTLTVSLGDGLSLLSGVFFAWQIALISLYTRKGADPLALTVIQFAVAAACAWPAALMTEPAPQMVWTWESASSLLYLTLVVSALGMLMQNVGQSMTPSGTAAILMSLESVFGVLFSVLFWGERVTWRLALGFCLVFFAVLLSETKLSFLRRKRPA